MSVITESERADHFTAAAREALENGEAVYLSVSGHDFELDAELAKAIITLLDGSTRGSLFEVSSLPSELTTGQAAELLGVTRPTVVSLIDRGKLPASRVGTHRRVATVDVLAYRESTMARRHTGMDEVVALSDDLGLYDK